MKIVAASNGKKTVKISKSEWTSIGEQAGWLIKKAQQDHSEQLDIVLKKLQDEGVKEYVKDEVFYAKLKLNRIQEELNSVQEGLNKVNIFDDSPVDGGRIFFINKEYGIFDKREDGYHLKTDWEKVVRDNAEKYSISMYKLLSEKVKEKFSSLFLKKLTGIDVIKVESRGGGDVRCQFFDGSEFTIRVIIAWPNIVRGRFTNIRFVDGTKAKTMSLNELVAVWK